MPKHDETDSPLGRMRDRLYKPGTSFDIQPSSLSARSSKMPHQWEAPAEEIKVVAAQKPKLSSSALFLIGSIGFFILAGIITFFLVLQGGLSVSSDRVSLTIENPPSQIAGGDTVSLFVVIQNENPAAMSDAKLYIDFPEGAYSPDDPEVALTHEVEAIGSIESGEVVKRTIRATLFGEANQRITIPMTLEYKTEGSNAVFEKKETFDFTIGTSPVSVNITGISEVSSGQTVSFDISVRSNAPAPLADVAVRAEYPFGFTPSKQGTLFTLGTLAPGEEKKVTVAGTLTGSDNDERVFKFSAGTARPDGSQNLAVSFITKEQLVRITKPFITVGLSLMGSTADKVVVRPGEPITATLSWGNSLSSSIQDAELSVRISGNALDKGSVQTNGGFYRSSDTTVLFNRETEESLRTLEPGDTGAGSFTFRTKSGDELKSLQNPSLTLTVSVAGRRVGESGVSEEVKSTITRTVQVASELSLSATANATNGPYPPKADTETTYSVRFAVTNGVNTVADGVVRGVLPSYVRFVGSNSGVTYNETTREVTWTVGEIAAHTNNKSATFQVALTPSSSQLGTSPILVTSPTLSGFDRYVQKTVTSPAPSVDSGGRVQ